MKFRRSWKVTYHHGWDDWVTNPFEKMVDETYQDIRSKYTLFLAGDDNSNQVAVYDNSNVEIVVRDVLLLL